MKKVLVSLVAIFMVTGIVGCGNSKTAPGEENTQKAEETTKNVETESTENNSTKPSDNSNNNTSKGSNNENSNNKQ